MVNDDLHAWAVARLRGWAVPQTISEASRIGALLVEHVYGGDLSALRSRRRKSSSLRRLAAEPGLRLNAVTLWRAVAIHLLVRDLPWLGSATHLRLSHVRATLGLEPQTQKLLLARAEAGRWTKRRIEGESSRARHAAAPR